MNRKMFIIWRSRGFELFGLILSLFILINFGGFERVCLADETNTRVQQIEQLVQEACSAKTNTFNGTVMVAIGDKVIYSGYCGKSNIQLNTENQLDTKYLVGSNTKGFTATIIMQLVAQGKINLDKTICDYLSWYKHSDKIEQGAVTHQQITIRELLEMSSGIPDYTSTPKGTMSYALIFYYPWETVQFVMNFCMPRELEFEPGTEYNYSNSNYYILGAIIEQVTGKSFAEVLRENILDVIKLEDTGVYKYQAIIPKKASGYFEGKTSMEFAQPKTSFSAGYMYSTVSDFHKWHQALYDSDSLLPAKLKAEMFVPRQSVTGLNCWYYGYGWGIEYLGKDSPDPNCECPQRPGKEPMPEGLIKSYSYVGYYPDGFCAAYYHVPDFGQSNISIMAFSNYGSNSCSSVSNLASGIRNILLYGKANFD